MGKVANLEIMSSSSLLNLILVRYYSVDILLRHWLNVLQFIDLWSKYLERDTVNP